MAALMPLLCSPGRSFAPGVYYVDNSGNPPCSNSSSGSQTTPWCTISHGIRQITAGDTLYVKAGTYEEDLYIDGPAGMPTTPTMIRAYPGQVVTVMGAGVDSGRVKIVNTRDLIFSGFTVTRFNQGIFVESSERILIENNTVQNVGQEAIHVMGNSSFVRVEGNVVHDTRKWQYNGEAVYIGSGSQGTLDNTNNVVVKNNVLYNATDEAVDLKPGTHDCVVEGNLIYNVTRDPSWSQEWGAIEVSQSTGGNQRWNGPPNHVIRNNIIHSSKTAIRLGTGSIAYNNVIYNTSAPYYGIYLDNIDHDTYERRAYHNTVDLPPDRAVRLEDASADIRNNIGPNTSNNISTESSFYADRARGDYRLVASSPPIGKGVDLTNVVAVDMDGKPRSRISDLGAYEFVPRRSGSISAKTWTTATCSQLDVQTIVNVASDGDTVQIPSGTCVWSVPVKIVGKGITLRGAGVDQTTIVDTMPSANVVEAEVNSAYSTTRITGFTFNASQVAKNGTLAEVAVYATSDAADGFRVDHVKIANLHSRGVLVAMNGYDASGLIDSCEIVVPLDGPTQGITIEGSGPQLRTPFRRPLTLGSRSAIYVEDCRFEYSSPNDGVLDAYTGARYVFRNSIINGTFISHHGADSGDGAGVASFEIYNNSFDTAGVSGIGQMMFFRSGTGVVFGNKFATSGAAVYSRPITLTNYRSWQAFGYWGKCDGSSPWDENQAGKQGYACLDQIGHFFTENQGGGNSLKPLYLWANTLNGTRSNAVVQGDLGPALALHIQENRDFYNQAETFSGNTGVGTGLLVSRPPTCVPFTGYFATDMQTLYQCGAANSWTSYYTPYAYPHPLRGGKAIRDLRTRRRER